MKLSELSASIESLSGIGPATAKQFAKLNIFTVADLLSSFPRDYEDRSNKISTNPKSIQSVKSHHTSGLDLER